MEKEQLVKEINEKLNDAYSKYNGTGKAFQLKAAEIAAEYVLSRVPSSHEEGEEAGLLSTYNEIAEQIAGKYVYSMKNASNCREAIKERIILPLLSSKEGEIKALEAKLLSTEFDRDNYGQVAYAVDKQIGELESEIKRLKEENDLLKEDLRCEKMDHAQAVSAYNALKNHRASSLSADKVKEALQMIKDAGANSPDSIDEATLKSFAIDKADKDLNITLD